MQCSQPKTLLFCNNFWFSAQLMNSVCREAFTHNVLELVPNDEKHLSQLIHCVKKCNIVQNSCTKTCYVAQYNYSTASNIILTSYIAL